MENTAQADVIDIQSPRVEELVKKVQELEQQLNIEKKTVDNMRRTTGATKAQMRRMFNTINTY